MSEVAKAYIQLVPSASGIKGAITKELGGEADDAGRSAGEGFSKSFGGALAGIGKVVAGAVAAGAAAVGKLTKDAVEGFADYEQLTGGVETLFKDSADAVMEYAANAYKTAGLSANEYMETVTSFSASLLQSLGGDTEKAANTADMAISDMSDNANKMGSSMESIQNAYQGFAKQNYTMLDNLKLGYGGTKTEMERLLADATALSGVEYDIDSLSDVYEAIHVIQGELGITGTTAKEASETISGSLAAMKSSWANLLVGIADENANFDELVGNFVESAVTVGDNLLPRIEQTLAGVGALVQGLAPVIAEAVPVLVNDALPALLTAGASLAGALGEALLENSPYITQAALDLVLMLAQGLSDPDSLNNLIDSVVLIITDMVNWFAEYSNVLIDAAVDLILALADGLTNPDNISSLIDSAIYLVTELANGLINALPKLIEKAPEIVENLMDAIIENAPKLLESAAELIVTLAKGVVNNLPKIFEKGKEIVKKLVEGIAQLREKMTEKAKELIEKLKTGIAGKFEEIKTKGKELVEKIKDGLLAKFADIKTKGRELVETVKAGFMEKIQNAKQWGQDLIQNFIDGIKAKWESLRSAVSGLAQTVSSYLHFSEPDVGPLSNFSTYAPDMMMLFAQGIRDNAHYVTDQISKSFNIGPQILVYGFSGADMPAFAVAQAAPTAQYEPAYGGDIVIDLTTTLDGQVLSRNQYRYNKNEIQRRGGNAVR